MRMTLTRRQWGALLGASPLLTRAAAQTPPTTPHWGKNRKTPTPEYTRSASVSPKSRCPWTLSRHFDLWPRPTVHMPKTKLDENTIAFASIGELTAALRHRDISSVELTKILGRRLEKLGPEYNALAYSLVKQGHKAAKDADYDLKHERFRSPLQGIPYAVKDLIAVAKHPTTWGAKPFADQVFDEDATVVRRLASKQAILIGKLSMVELAGGGGYSSAAASLQGPGLNPWNKQYWSGGSSSGSGAAVAAGLVPFASWFRDVGIHHHARLLLCVSGLRPTYGLVSRHGAMALSWTLDKIGVLARSAEDCGLVLHAIAGGDDDDPGSAQKSFYYAPQYYENQSELKIGYAEIDFAEWPDEPLRPAFANALAVVKSIGVPTVESQLPDFPYGPLISCIIDSEAASIFERFIRSGRVDQLADQHQIDGLKASLNYSALDYLKAMRVRTQIQAAFRTLFASVDLLVAPARLNLPDRADRPFDETPPKRPDRKGVVAGLVQAANLADSRPFLFPVASSTAFRSDYKLWDGRFGESHFGSRARIPAPHRFSQTASAATGLVKEARAGHQQYSHRKHRQHASLFPMRQNRMKPKEEKGTRNDGHNRRRPSLAESRRTEPIRAWLDQRARHGCQLRGSARRRRFPSR